jgi:hypothetical protein
MSDAWKDGADENIQQTIAEGLNERGCIVTGWVLAVVYVDEDGKTATAFNANADSTRVQTLGLLDYATQVQHSYILSECREDDD